MNIWVSDTVLCVSHSFAAGDLYCGIKTCPLRPEFISFKPEKHAGAPALCSQYDIKCNETIHANDEGKHKMADVAKLGPSRQNISPSFIGRKDLFGANVLFFI